MLRAMDSAVAGLRAHQSKLDVIGHNIANVNTYGFKSQSYSFKEAMYQTSASSTAGTTGQNATGGTNAAQYGYGSLTGAISTDMTASTPTYIGGFNASINGEGFFITFPTLQSIDVSGNAEADSAALKSKDLDYTRVGMFTIDSNGYMVDSTGNFVYGYRAENGASNPVVYDETQLQALRAPVTVVAAKAAVIDPGDPDDPDDDTITTPAVPAESSTEDGGIAKLLSDIKINTLGEVTATIKAPGEEIDGMVVSLGKVAIATFQNPEGMTKKGDIYYSSITGDNTGLASAAMPGGTTSDLMTGYVEASNVDLAKEFSDMITTQRGFQANSRIITVSDQILEELVNMKR